MGRVSRAVLVTTRRLWFFCVCWVWASPPLTRCLGDLCWAGGAVVTDTTAKITTTLLARDRDRDRGLVVDSSVPGGRDVMGFTTLSMTPTMTLSTTHTTPSRPSLPATSLPRLMTTTMMTWLATRQARDCQATEGRRRR